ncbi:MAG: 50S ribosomal protein L11 methyltransferase [Gammaproteobacteria bacterium]|jgi:ribosomal protein L11 methyltransferase
MHSLSFDIETEEFLRIEKVLLFSGAVSVTQTLGNCDVFDEPSLSEIAKWSTCRIIALFNTRSESDFALSQVSETFQVGTLKQDELSDTDWSKSWKEEWLPQTFAETLCICPSWCRPPDNSLHIVIIDPGQAFGTGSHETTSLCLTWLGQNLSLLDDACVIDYGSGSGILGISAIRLGARHVTGVELDKDAIVVSRDNAIVNGVQEKIAFVEKIAPEVENAADILVANILFKPILELEPVFHRLLKCDGVLLLSGILASQVDRVVRAYSERFSIELLQTDGDWALLRATRL